jgi:hypothetical protein
LSYQKLIIGLKQELHQPANTEQDVFPAQSNYILKSTLFGNWAIVVGLVKVNPQIYSSVYHFVACLKIAFNSPLPHPLLLYPAVFVPCCFGNFTMLYSSVKD